MKNILRESSGKQSINKTEPGMTSNLGQTTSDLGQTSNLGGTTGQTSNLGGTTGQTSNLGGTTGQTTSHLGGTTGQTSHLGQTVSNLEQTASHLGATTGLSSNLGQTTSTSTRNPYTGNLSGQQSYTQQGYNQGGYNQQGSGLVQGSGYNQQGSGLVQGSGYTQQGSGLVQGSGFTHTQHVETVTSEVHRAPTIVSEKFEKPVIVKEKIMPQERIEIQPIIHREREQLEVHEITQPLHERDIAATEVRHATLPAQIRPEFRESDSSFQTSYKAANTRYSSEVVTEETQREFMNKAPIVEEHIHKKIIEEIQPVLYKETYTPVLIEETQPIYEKIVEAPTIVEETRKTVDLGTKYHTGTLPVQQMRNLSFEGQPTTQRTTTVTKEVFIEPTTHRASSSPQTTSKRIV